MKKIVYLFWLFSVLISCKQTQLTSNYNKRSYKIYTKAPLEYKDFDVVSKENISTVAFKSSAVVNSFENQLYSIEKSGKDEFLTDLKIKEIKEVSLANSFHKRNLKVDSILKYNSKYLSDEEEIAKTAKRAKKFSIYSFIAAALSVITAILYGSPESDVLAISSFILSFISLIQLIKSLKIIKKNRDRIQDQDDNLKKNIIISLGLLMLILVLVPIGFIIFALTFSISPI